LRLLRCFSSPGSPLAAMYSQQDACRCKRVFPFGDLRFSVCLPTYRSLSQATTSFIAFCRLGIHHMRLVTWPYNLKHSRACDHEQATCRVLGQSTCILLPKNTVFNCNLIVKER